MSAVNNNNNNNNNNIIIIMKRKVPNKNFFPNKKLRILQNKEYIKVILNLLIISIYIYIVNLIFYIFLYIN